jgi:hypothetical protein
MSKFQNKLRLLIVTGSAVGFVGGWGLLAHAGKPVATTTSATADPASVTLPSQLPPIDFKSLESASGGTSNLQPLPVMPPSSSFGRMRLRTGGS